MLSSIACFYASLDFHKYPCPFCGAKHPDWTIHGSYERSAVDWRQDTVVDERVRLIRLRCSSCTTTHAVLPPWIIPHRHYSLFVILAVMRDYFLNTLTVKDIQQKYGISANTLYQWKTMFLEHQTIWLRLLNNALALVPSPKQFLDLLDADDNTNVLQDFLRLTGRSFLQRAGRRTAYCGPP